MGLDFLANRNYRSPGVNYGNYYHENRTASRGTHSSALGMEKEGFGGSKPCDHWNGNGNYGTQHVPSCFCSVRDRSGSDGSRIYIGKYEYHLAHIFFFVRKFIL